MLKGKTPLVIAVGLFFVGFVVSFIAIEKRRNDVMKGWNLVPVLVATAPIAEGTKITADMVMAKSIPEQFVTASVIKPDSLNYILENRVLVALQANDPLLWSQFETNRAAERLSTKVLSTWRAVTINAKATTAVGGWVRPNDHVDIIGTFKDPTTNEQIAVTLLQNVTVLATGKITGTTNVALIPENERTYNDVSLLVLPGEAEMLVLAQELGTLSLTLRTGDDIGVNDDRGRSTTLKTLTTGEQSRALQQKRLNTIQFIRGSTVNETPTGERAPE